MILIKTSYIIIIMRMNICMVINQIIKHKVKISNHYTYIQIIIKTFLLFQYIKIFFFFVKYKNDKAIITRAKTDSTN